MNNTEKKLREYMRLPYTVVLKRDEEGDVVARVKELEGCVADGQDEMEAIGNLEQVKEIWLRAALKSGSGIPLPEKDDDDLPSGKWLMRVPRTLHKKLVDLADSEGVSLNQFVTACLAEAVGEKRANVGTINASAIDPAYGVSSVKFIEIPLTKPHPVLPWDQQKPFVRAIASKDRFTFSERREPVREEDKTLAS